MTLAKTPPDVQAAIDLLYGTDTPSPVAQASLRLAVAGAASPCRRLALLPPLASDGCWQCKAELPALADAASPCPLCGAELLLL